MVIVYVAVYGRCSYMGVEFATNPIPTPIPIPIPTPTPIPIPGTVRIVLWSRGQLTELQAEMALKNVAFLYNVYSASDMYTTTKRRDWNAQDLACGLQYPARETQLIFFRWSFMLCYLCQGALMSQVLSAVTPASQAYRWQSNTGFDLMMVAIFYVYCSNCYNRRR